MGCFGSKEKKAAPAAAPAAAASPSKATPPPAEEPKQQNKTPETRAQSSEPEHFHDNDKLAEEANVHRDAARKLRDEAHNEKDKARRNELHERANAEDAAASKLCYETLNKNSPDGTVDLHLQFVAEAVKIAEEESEKAKSKGLDKLTLIVGKGNHSKGNKPLIHPAIVEWSQKKGYAYEELEGRIVVTLK